MPQNAPASKDDFLYIEDLHLGQKFKAGPVKITAEEIITFAKQFDPQDFHTDPVKASETIFGGLAASGWHTGGLTMRMMLQALPKIKGGMVGRGAEKIEWPRPVRPGDELSVEMEVIDIKISDNRPESGVMKTRNTTFNQKGEIVMRMETKAFIPRREKA